MKIMSKIRKLFSRAVFQIFLSISKLVMWLNNLYTERLVFCHTPFKSFSTFFLTHLNIGCFYTVLIKKICFLQHIISTWRADRCGPVERESYD